MLYCHDASICKQLLRIVVDQLPVSEGEEGWKTWMKMIPAEFAYTLVSVSHPPHPHTHTLTPVDEAVDIMFQNHFYLVLHFLLERKRVWVEEDKGSMWVY